jgi:hypothetical protein
MTNLRGLLMDFLIGSVGYVGWITFYHGINMLQLDSRGQIAGPWSYIMMVVGIPLIVVNIWLMRRYKIWRLG